MLLAKARYWRYRISTILQSIKALYTLSPEKVKSFVHSADVYNYDWKKESWSLLFAVGVILGGFLAGYVFANPDPIAIAQSTQDYFASFGIATSPGLMPTELFNWPTLFSAKGFLLMIVGGYLVGFGTRYARGCTSGHGILGLSALQWPSLLAIASFFAGGILLSKYVLPYILSL